MKKAINIFIAALLAVTLISKIRIIFWGNVTPSVIIVQAILAAICILVLYYNFCGYKKPHGNLLRYTFLIYGSTRIINQLILEKSGLQSWCLIIAGIIIIYMSGRLNKIEKNKILTIVVLALHAVFAALNIFSIDISLEAAKNASLSRPEIIISLIFAYCTGLFIWAALALAYTSRYGAHKEAGLEDKPKA